MDSGPIGDAPLIFALAAGTRVKAIGANRSDSYGTAVLVRPDSPLKTAADLKGKSIATNRGSIGHYVTLKAITAAGLKPEDVNLRFLAPADAKLALTQGSVDAWATWEPYTALAETSRHARVLVSGRGLLPGLSYLAATDAAHRRQAAGAAGLSAARGARAALVVPQRRCLLGHAGAHHRHPGRRREAAVRAAPAEVGAPSTRR